MAALLPDLNSTEETFLMKRLEVPHDLKCHGCNSVIAKGVKVNAVVKISEAGHSTTEGLKKEHVIRCAYCGHDIVMEKASKASKFRPPYYLGAQRTDNLLAEVDEEVVGGRDIFEGFSPGWRENRFKYAFYDFALVSWPPKDDVDE